MCRPLAGPNVSRRWLYIGSLKGCRRVRLRLTVKRRRLVKIIPNRVMVPNKSAFAPIEPRVRVCREPKWAGDGCAVLPSAVMPASIAVTGPLLLFPDLVSLLELTTFRN